MKSNLLAILLVGVVFLGASSCATTPKAPLAPGEVRLLSFDVVGLGLEAYSSFAVNVFFEAAGKPNIKTACFYESFWGQYCFDITDESYFTLGKKKAFHVRLPGINPGSYRVGCYAEYIRNGEVRRTNVVFTQVMAHASPRNR